MMPAKTPNRLEKNKIFVDLGGNGLTKQSTRPQKVAGHVKFFLKFYSFLVVLLRKHMDTFGHLATICVPVVLFEFSVLR